MRQKRTTRKSERGIKMLNKEAEKRMLIYWRRKRHADCRRAARLLYQARQLGKAAGFIWNHRADADLNEITNMRTAVMLQASQLRAEARLLLAENDEKFWR